MTLLEIRDQCKIDGNILDDNDFPDLRLNLMINQAQRFVQAELNGLGMKLWEAKEALSISGTNWGGEELQVQTAALPADMLESPKSILLIECLDTDTAGGIAKEVKMSDFHDVGTNTFLAPDISSPIFMRIDNTIYLLPAIIVSADVYYWKTVTVLSANGTESEIPEEFIEYVIRRVVSQIEKIKGNINVSVTEEKDLSNDIAVAHEKFVGKMVTEQPTEILE